jgi:hypothetical protein
MEIGFVRGDRAMFAVELADEEYHAAKGICEVGRGDNFDTNGECERVMGGVFGTYPSACLGAASTTCSAKEEKCTMKLLAAK